MIDYEVNASNPQSHLFHIKMKVLNPNPQGQTFFMPLWIPGSYLIRDFARHVVSMKAFEEFRGTHRPIAIHKQSDHSWLCEKVSGTLLLQYEIYAFDHSVRGAYLDNEYGFFNGASLFLCALGHEHSEHNVKINPPNVSTADSWRIATTLKKTSASTSFFSFEFANYRADSFDELIDHPVQMGQFEVKEFTAHNILHQIVVSGTHDGCLDRLTTDVAKICQAQLRLFGEPAPFNHYLFLLHVKKDTYGGLEHRQSSALQIPRICMPLKNELDINAHYLSLLSLFSHEYFHAWNVKKIKPSAFSPYDLSTKAFTSQLWAYEGITSYYDDLMLVRAKVISVEQYFDILAQAITKLIRTPGRKKQTLLESSYDTWIKFYQPNENTPNMGVSYYLKGSLVALLIDLTLRLHSDKTLDDFMRMLYQEFGQTNQGTPEKEIEKRLIAWGGQPMQDLLTLALYTTEELPLEKALDKFGLLLTYRIAQSIEDIGGKKSIPNKNEETQEEKMRQVNRENTEHSANIAKGHFNWLIQKNQGKIVVITVLEGSCAQKAGVLPLDEIIAINGIKIDADSYEKIIKRLNSDEKVMIHVFRQDILKVLSCVLDKPSYDTAQISIKSSLSNQKQNKVQDEKTASPLEKWLHQ